MWLYRFVCSSRMWTFNVWYNGEYRVRPTKTGLYRWISVAPFVRSYRIRSAKNGLYRWISVGRWGSGTDENWILGEYRAPTKTGLYRWMSVLPFVRSYRIRSAKNGLYRWMSVGLSLSGIDENRINRWISGSDGNRIISVNVGSSVRSIVLECRVALGMDVIGQCRVDRWLSDTTEENRIISVNVGSSD